MPPAIGGRRKLEPKTIEWPLPQRGTWNGINDTALPLDVLFDSKNCTIRDGKLLGRPGLTLVNAQVFDSRPTGALNIYQTDGSPFLIMGTLGKVWAYDFTSWSDRGSPFSGNADSPVRITQFITGTPPVTKAYLVNGVDTLQSLVEPAGTLTAIAAAPVFKDIATAGDRIIGLVDAYEVRWGEILVDDDFPALNSRLLSDTPSKTVALRPIGTLGVVIYKQDSIWLGVVTGKTGGSAFCFTLIGFFDGPGGPNAIANAKGSDYYMTQYGRVGKFDGSTHKWVAEGTWAKVKAEIDQAFPRRITAVYHAQEEEVHFTYPRVGDSGENLGLLIVTLPKPEVGIQAEGAYVGESGRSITAMAKIDRESQKTPIVFTSGSPGGSAQSFTIDGTDDDGVTVVSFFQTGLQPVFGAEPSRVLNAEPFLERSGGFGTIFVRMSSSNVLDTPGGTLSVAPGRSVDLTDAASIKTVLGFDVRGRFVALRIEFDSTATVRYLGATLRAQEGL